MCYVVLYFVISFYWWSKQYKFSMWIYWKLDFNISNNLKKFKSINFTHQVLSSINIFLCMAKMCASWLRAPLNVEFVLTFLTISIFGFISYEMFLENFLMLLVLRLFFEFSISFSFLDNVIPCEIVICCTPWMSELKNYLVLLLYSEYNCTL